MSKRVMWIGIVVMLLLTALAASNCRKLPDPWVPQAGTSDNQPQH
jgi:hypothetical protein